MAYSNHYESTLARPLARQERLERLQEQTGCAAAGAREGVPEQGGGVLVDTGAVSDQYPPGLEAGQ